MANKQIDILGFVVSSSIQELELNTKSVLINTINPHSYCVSQTDKLFYEALMSSDVLIPDGMGIVLAASILRKEKISRITGADLHSHLLGKLNAVSGKVFYLGASPQTLEKIQGRLATDYPHVVSACCSPPYKPVFSDDDNKAMILAINQFQPDILFVGMTAPKQEKWVYQHKKEIDAKIICSIGAVFDFYAGTVKRPGKYWIRFGLEWLRRFMKEPKRLWRRNLISTPIFIKDVLLAKFGLLKSD